MVRGTTTTTTTTIIIIIMTILIMLRAYGFVLAGHQNVNKS